MRWQQVGRNQSKHSINMTNCSPKYILEGFSARIIVHYDGCDCLSHGDCNIASYILHNDLKYFLLLDCKIYCLIIYVLVCNVKPVEMSWELVRVKVYSMCRCVTSIGNMGLQMLILTILRSFSNSNICCHYVWHIQYLTCKLCGCFKVFLYTLKKYL